ncbi:MAG: undecaprenyl-phosphate galactose phosphotransferase WbaP [Treponema sp.]|nr:undecaprenyl-phosphate galactose phosphotransferase WbaP [Treponema sp.]
MTSDELLNYLKSKYPQTSSFISGLSLFFVDLLVIMLSLGIGFFIVNLLFTSDLNFKSVVNYFFFSPVFVLTFAAVGLYPGIMIPPTEEVKKFCGCTFFALGAMTLGIVIADINDYTIAEAIIKDSADKAVILAFAITFPVATILLPGIRELAKTIFGRFKWWGVPAVIYSTNHSADFIIEKLIKYPYLGYHPAVIVDSAATGFSEFKGIPLIPPSKEMLDNIRAHNVKTAVICSYDGDMRKIMSSYRYTITVSKQQTTFTSTQQLKDIAGIIAFSSVHNLTFRLNKLLKRLLDLFVILALAPVWVPVFIICAILTKITSRGPIFYGHKRVGRNGKVIKCWKFRSMVVNSQEILEKLLAENEEMRIQWEKDRKLEHDPRITKFGKILRKTSMDELPQLINILLGEMSLVGPRPVTEPELEKYGDYKDYVLSVKPGLSGMWQISGRSDTGYEERISYDTYYIQNWSIWLDIWILIKSVWVVLLGKGAY